MSLRIGNRIFAPPAWAVLLAAVALAAFVSLGYWQLGRDLAGWQRLIRALTVLGRKDEAVAALGRARKSLADEPTALAALSDLAKSLGLGT